MAMLHYDRLYVEFIYYFNVERDYFECHEVMEELWLEEGRFLLYQGLLQVAVGLYHFRNGNINGSIKLFRQAVDKLCRYGPTEGGIALEKLLRQSEQYLRQLEQYQEQPFSFYDLDIEVVDAELAAQVERLKLNPPQPEEDEHH